MWCTKKGKLEVPPREPGEAPCTPEQAVQLARYCPDETFEKIRTLGTWQAGKAIAQCQRMEQQLNEEIACTVPAKAKHGLLFYMALVCVVAMIILIIWWL